jgi:3-dehydrosphinganine reductase
MNEERNNNLRSTEYQVLLTVVLVVTQQSLSSDKTISFLPLKLYLMLTLIIAGILSLPGLLVHLVTVPIIAFLSIPALSLLIFRKPASVKPSLDSSGPETKRVIITGGSSGIGKCIACEAAKQGISEVVIIARNAERLEAARKEILAVNANILVITLSVDVSDSDALTKAAMEICNSKDEPPKTTHLFCCAGDTVPAYFQEVTSEMFAYIVKTNQLGSIYTAQAFIPLMETGSVTFCSSMVGQIGVFGYASYAPTKFAIRGYAECLHVELCNSPIHIQVAYPPDTDTPCFERENKTKPEETRLVSEQGGMKKPEDVARVMLKEALKENPPFNVYFNLEGWFVSTLTTGFSPVSTLLDAVAQVSGMSLIRWIVLFVLQDWYRMIRTHQTKKRQSDTSKND